MTDDTTLSQQWTAAIRSAPGVAGVFPAQPVLEAAAESVAVRLTLRAPDILVDIDRADDFTTITAHISSATGVATPATLRRVGELILGTLPDDIPADRVAVNVKVRLVEDAPALDG